MNAKERRSQIRQQLLSASVPVSASALARQFEVSRQIIVGDIALLRASGFPVTATPRGYLVLEKPAAHTCTIACRHSRQDLLDELYTIVDTGCTVVDVVVEHPVYGQLTGNLAIASRYEADLFWQALCRHQAAPLCQLTGDVHLHTLTYPNPDALERCRQALAQKGYLWEEAPCCDAVACGKSEAHFEPQKKN